MNVSPIGGPMERRVTSAGDSAAWPWAVGSIVSGQSFSTMPGDPVVVQIEGTTVSLDPPVADEIPKMFRALVIADGDHPTLEVMVPAIDESPARLALRTLLPHQDGFQPLLADLFAIGRVPGVRALPQPVRTALALLEASIVGRDDLLDPDLLREALWRSGLQLEYTLLEHALDSSAVPSGKIAYDIKAALLRLSAALVGLPLGELNTPARYTDTPPPLLELPLQPQPSRPVTVDAGASVLLSDLRARVSTAITRIEIMQLQAAMTASSPTPVALAEVPVRGTRGFNLLQVRIEREVNDGVEPSVQTAWTLGLIVNTSELGAVQGELRLCGTALSVDLWAERRAAIDALNEQVPVLPELLRASGLRLAFLRVRQGLPRRGGESGSGVLDTRA